MTRVEAHGKQAAPLFGQIFTDSARGGVGSRTGASIKEFLKQIQI